jgi:hypothetical protein
MKELFNTAKKYWYIAVPVVVGVVYFAYKAFTKKKR